MSADALVITTMQPEDWPKAAAIYAEGIASGVASFATHVPAWETWNASRLMTGRLVAWRGTEMLGWTALGRYATGAYYDGVAEVSIYVAGAARGHGVGKHLLTALIAASEEAGIWMLESRIMRGNSTSVRLHESCGFRIVGYRERIAQRDGIWHDTLLMERRSHTVGV